jgi:DNA-binding response OmpR family regulator
VAASGGVSGVHIILVEDDAQLGAAIQRALERLSYTVTWLRDGRSASSALADRSADLVLLDLGLPGRDGWRCSPPPGATTSIPRRS